MPKAVYHAYGYVKKAAALVNAAAGRLPDWKTEAIVQAAEETIAGTLDEHFPLYVWQTGSGTQSNMNVNEVIANRAIQLLGGELGTKDPVAAQRRRQHGPVQQRHASRPRCTSRRCRDRRAPAPPSRASWRPRSRPRPMQWDEGRQDRTHPPRGRRPAHRRSGMVGLRGAAGTRASTEIEHEPEGLYELALGGTAVGTGLNAPQGFSRDVAAKIAELTGKPFITAPNKFMAQGSLDAMVRANGALRGLAVALMKIANDMRWLASGPRAGFAELKLPQNEPGSSIMPGKVNPTQCEAIVMIAIQVLGDDSAVALAGSQGNFELNAMRPMIINNFLHSARILADGMEKFRTYSVSGTELNEDKIQQYVQESLMLVTALSPVIGYQKAAHIAEEALANDQTLKEAALASGDVDEDTFDTVVDPLSMIGDGVAGA